MSAALATVVAAVGGAGGRARAFAVLGDMLEMGPDAEELHRALGREAGVRLAGVVVAGRLRRGGRGGARAAGLAPERTKVAASPEDAAAVIASWTAPGDWILVKASRGMRLERVVDALRGGLVDAVPPVQQAARDDPGRERLPLRVDAHRPGDADVAVDHVHGRALVHPRARASASSGELIRDDGPAGHAKKRGRRRWAAR